jgi:hypothetical protein
MEEELATVIQEQQEQLHYRLEGSKIGFEENLRHVHHELKTGVPRSSPTSGTKMTTKPVS